MATIIITIISYAIILNNNSISMRQLKLLRLGLVLPIKISNS